MIKQIISKIQQKDKRQKWRLSSFWKLRETGAFFAEEKVHFGKFSIAGRACQDKLTQVMLKELEWYMLCLFKDILKLSAVRKVLETRWFLALRSFKSKTVRGTVLACAKNFKSEGAQK